MPITTYRVPGDAGLGMDVTGERWRRPGVDVTGVGRGDLPQVRPFSPSLPPSPLVLRAWCLCWLLYGTVPDIASLPATTAHLYAYAWTTMCAQAMLPAASGTQQSQRSAQDTELTSMLQALLFGEGAASASSGSSASNGVAACASDGAAVSASEGAIASAIEGVATSTSERAAANASDGGTCQLQPTTRSTVAGVGGQAGTCTCLATSESCAVATGSSGHGGGGVHGPLQGAAQRRGVHDSSVHASGGLGLRAAPTARLVGHNTEPGDSAASSEPWPDPSVPADDRVFSLGVRLQAMERAVRRVAVRHSRVPGGGGAGTASSPGASVGTDVCPTDVCPKLAVAPPDATHASCSQHAQWSDHDTLLRTQLGSTMDAECATCHRAGGCTCCLPANGAEEGMHIHTRARKPTRAARSSPPGGDSAAIGATPSPVTRRGPTSHSRRFEAFAARLAEQLAGMDERLADGSTGPEQWLAAAESASGLQSPCETPGGTACDVDAGWQRACGGPVADTTSVGSLGVSASAAGDWDDDRNRARVRDTAVKSRPARSHAPKSAPVSCDVAGQAFALIEGADLQHWGRIAHSAALAGGTAAASASRLALRAAATHSATSGRSANNRGPGPGPFRSQFASQVYAKAVVATRTWTSEHAVGARGHRNAWAVEQQASTCVNQSSLGTAAAMAEIMGLVDNPSAAQATGLLGPHAARVTSSSDDVAQGTEHVAPPSASNSRAGTGGRIQPRVDRATTCSMRPSASKHALEELTHLMRQLNARSTAIHADLVEAKGLSYRAVPAVRPSRARSTAELDGTFYRPAAQCDVGPVRKWFALGRDGCAHTTGAHGAASPSSGARVACSSCAACGSELRTHGAHNIPVLPWAAPAVVPQRAAGVGPGPAAAHVADTGPEGRGRVESSCGQPGPASGSARLVSYGGDRVWLPPPRYFPDFGRPPQPRRGAT